MLIRMSVLLNTRSVILGLAIVAFSLPALAADPAYTAPLGAGVTLKPNDNYQVYDPTLAGFEPPLQAQHNSRVCKPDNSAVCGPYYLLKPELSSAVPVHVKPHSRLVLSDIEDRPFFDYFGWQAFIGLIWPADLNYRGKPDAAVGSQDFVAASQQNDSGINPPVVLETLQTFDAAFPQTDDPSKAPKPWNTIAYSRPFNLDLASKGKAPTGLNEAFSRPLVDQNHQYVRYNLQLNEVMYEFIRENKWYLKGNLPKAPTQASLPPLPVAGSLTQDPLVIMNQPQTSTTVTQPVNGNSIELKSAWRVMITEQDLDPAKPWRQVDDLSRYYVSTANVMDPVTGEIKTNALVGLVGLHIVAKTPQFTQGLWSSFEHVDNVVAPHGGRASFNRDGRFWPEGFSYKPDAFQDTATGPTGAVAEDKRKPVEVSRIYKIPETPVVMPQHRPEGFPEGLSTVAMNATYQKLLKGTVWENYQLVVTQWPTDPTTFYAKPFYYPRGFPSGSTVDPDQPQSVKDAVARAEASAAAAYPRWAGLPIPQVGALNTVMETYFQNPSAPQAMENTSCMGCHYGASDMDFSWALKLRAWPNDNGFAQGRVNIVDSELASEPAYGSPSNQVKPTE